MTRSVTVIPSTPAHIMDLTTRLRVGDAMELEAAGLSPNKALWRSYRGSVFSKTAFVDGEIAAAWGMGGCPLGTTGRPWLLTAPPVERVPKAILKIGREEVGLMLHLCPHLIGIVDATYLRALRLLEMIGFQISDTFPYGPYEAPFRQYEMRRA